MLAQAQDEGNSTPMLIYQDGMPMNAIWAVPSLGIDPTTGQVIYVKKDGTLTYEYDSSDMIVAGVSDPKYNGNSESHSNTKVSVSAPPAPSSAADSATTRRWSTRSKHRGIHG
ncbi:MAG: hypothetical protein V8Q54_06145 [Alistipes senegalensis]